jgi:hypothetical protein
MPLSQPEQKREEAQPSQEGQENKGKKWLEKVESFPLHKWMFEKKKWERVIEWGAPGNPFLQKKSRSRATPTQLWQILFSIGGAILVGTAMGFSILHLFYSNDPVHSPNSIDDHLIAPAKVGVKGSVQQGPSEKALVTLPALNAVMLQAGNFGDKAGAIKMVRQYRTDGLAAVMSENAPYRIFLGIAQNRDDALKLSAIYQKRNVPVYLKEVQVQGEMNAREANAAQLAETLQKGNRLFQLLSELSAQGIHADPQEKGRAIGFQKGWMEDYRQFVIACQMLEKGMPDPQKKALDQMVQALDLAVQSGMEAGKFPSQALLWQIQEGLVRYVLAYELLIKYLK